MSSGLLTHRIEQLRRVLSERLEGRASEMLFARLDRVLADSDGKPEDLAARITRIHKAVKLFVDLDLAETVRDELEAAAGLDPSARR